MPGQIGQEVQAVLEKLLGRPEVWPYPCMHEKRRLPSHCGKTHGINRRGEGEGKKGGGTLSTDEAAPEGGKLQMSPSPETIVSTNGDTGLICWGGVRENDFYLGCCREFLNCTPGKTNGFAEVGLGILGLLQRDKKG